jgi:hypothetical protein
MKRIFLALVVACIGAAGPVTLRSQASAAKAALPACDANNGGLTLPAGFCALVVHEGGIGEARHIVVNDNGDIYVIRRNGGIVGLRDTNSDGKVDVVSEPFGTVGGTGLEPVLRGGDAHRPVQADAG